MIRSSQWSTVHVILSSQASNICTSPGVHTIILSSLHLPWLSTNLVIHLYSLIKKEHKKLLSIYVYRYLSNHFSFIRHGINFSCTTNSWIFLSNHSSISFFTGFRSCGITHLLMQILVPATKPFVGLVGPDPGLELVFQTNPYATSPFTMNPFSVDWSLTWSSIEGCWNQVSTPRD